jgi:Cu-Zn family superoxide dismutase
MNKRTIFTAIFLILICILLLFSCNKEEYANRNQDGTGESTKADSLNKTFMAMDNKRAVVLLIADITHNSGGVLSFTMETDKRMLIEGNFEGLKPGKYSIQIHQWGDCSAPGFTSTGPLLTSAAFYKNAPAGDTAAIGTLGYITAGNDGRAQIKTYSTRLSLAGSNSILGRSVVIHADSAGSAGRMISCGVVGLRL